MSEDIELDIWGSLSQKFEDVTISNSQAAAVADSPSPSSRKRKCVMPLNKKESKTIRRDSRIASLHIRQEKAESKIFRKNKKNSLCKILELFPDNSLAAVSKTFCEASYLGFRQKIPNKSFIRTWKDSSIESGGNYYGKFSEKLHYHRALTKSQNVPPVPKIECIVSFATDVSSEIVYSMQLPSRTILGCTDKVAISPKFNDIQIAKNEVCFSSLFIPQSDHYNVKTFALSVDFSAKDLEAVTNSRQDLDVASHPLKAIFILQYDDPPIFHANFFPWSRVVAVNGGIMSLSQEEGPDNDLAVGFSVFADSSVSVHLYGFNFSDTTDYIFYKMQEDLKSKTNGFCIFLWCWKAYAGNSKCLVKTESWESASTKEEEDLCNDLDFDDEKSTTDDEVLRVLKSFKLLFPSIPIVGCSTTNVMFNNGYQLSSRISASFLLIAY